MANILKYIGFGLGGVFVFILGVMIVSQISPIGLGFHSEVMTKDGFALGGYDVTTFSTNLYKKGLKNFLMNLKVKNGYLLQKLMPYYSNQAPIILCLSLVATVQISKFWFNSSF